MFIKLSSSLALLGLGVFAAADVQLWDNGPIITDATAGFGGAPISSTQTGNIVGIGIQSGAPNNHGADDFAIPANTKFRVKQLEFYTYQTGSTTTSTITATTLRIWDGIPGGGGAVIYDSSTTNRQTSSVFSGVYRVTQTNPLSTNRPLMRTTCTLPGGVVLDGGATGKTFWVSWQSTGTLSSGPWAALVSVVDERGKPGANGRQFASSAWNSIMDAGAPPGYDAPAPQDLAFKLSGRKTELLQAASFNVLSGEVFSGNLASLHVSDNNRLALFPDGTTLNASVELISQTTSNIGSPAMTVNLEHSVAREGLSIEVSLMDYTTNEYVVFFGQATGAADQLTSMETTNPNYISATGQIAMKVAFAPVNDEDPSQDGWTNSIDLVSFKVDP